MVGMGFAKSVGRCTGGPVGGHGREYVTAVEGGADGMLPVFRVGESPGVAGGWNGRVRVNNTVCGTSGGCERVNGLGGVAEGRVVLAADQGEEAVVGGDEPGVGGFQQDGSAVGAYTGIYYGDEDAAGGEVTVRIGEDDGTVANVLGADAVGEVDDVGGRVDAVDDAAHHADVGVGEAEIGEQDDGRRGHAGHGRYASWGSGR